MIGIYCRISSLKEVGTDRSIKEQKLRGIEIAKEYGKPYRVYIDEGISGTLPIDKRPGLSLLIDDVLSGELDSVFALDQSRLERSPQTRMILSQLFRDNNIDIYTTDGLVGKEIEDEFLGDMLSVINNFYTKITSKKIKAVIKRNQLEGKIHGKPNYGYNKTKDRLLEINDAEVEIVKSIFKESLSNIGISRIANGLNADGIKTKQGQTEWSSTVVRNIIVNTVYYGKRTTSVGMVDSPPIMSKEYWEKVQKNFKSNSHHSGPTSTKERLLRTILKCDKDGNNLYGHPVNNVVKGIKYYKDYYRCALHRKRLCKVKGLRVDVIDKFVWERFFCEKLLLDITREHFKETNYSSKIKTISKELDTLNKRIQKNETAKSRVIQMVIDNLIEDKDVRQKIEDINNIIRAAQETSKELLKEKDALTSMQDNSKSEVAEIRRIKTETTFKQRVELVSKYIDKIVYSREKGFIRLKFYYTFMQYPNSFYIDKEYNAAYSQRYKNSYYYDLREGIKNPPLDYDSIFLPIQTKITTL